MKEEEEVDTTPSTPVNTREAAPQTVAADEPGFTAVGKDGKGVTVIATENVLLKLREVLESRGKKVKKVTFYMCDLILTCFLEH
jgi:translation initiation factor 3 subunit C